MLQILVTFLGRRVYCQHCGGGFVAEDESLRLRGRDNAVERRSGDIVEALIERADWALRQGESPRSGCEATDE